MAHVVPPKHPDHDAYGNARFMPIMIDWPKNKDKSECVIMIGEPFAGIEQELTEITTEVDGVVPLKRVGSYADGRCGAYVLGVANG